MRGGGWRYFGVQGERDKTSIFCTWLAGGAGTGAMMSHHECRSSLAAALLSERVGRSRTVLEQQTAESVLDALAAGHFVRFRGTGNARHRPPAKPRPASPSGRDTPDVELRASSPQCPGRR